MADAEDVLHQIEYRWRDRRDLAPVASTMSPESLHGWDSWIRTWVRHPHIDGLWESLCYQVLPNGRAALAWRYDDRGAAEREDGTRGGPLVSRVLVGRARLLTPEVAIVLCRAGLPASAGPRPGQVSTGSELPLVPVGELSPLVRERAAGLDEEAARQDGLRQVVTAALSDPQTPLVILVPPKRILEPPGEGLQCPLLWGLRQVLWPLLGIIGRGWSFSTFEPPLGNLDPATLPDIVFRQVQDVPSAPPAMWRKEIKCRPLDPSMPEPDSHYAQLADWLVAEYRERGGDELRQLIAGCCGAEQSLLVRLDKVYEQLRTVWSPIQISPRPAVSPEPAQIAADESMSAEFFPSHNGHAFISYVREDSLHVDSLQRRLEDAGVRVWRDTADLWPGEDWRRKIRQAIQEDALVFIACFSERSLARKTSFQNEELTLAIEQLRRRRPDDPWLIPVRFSECEIPDLDIGADRTLRSIQRADLFGERSDEGIARLVAAILRILGPDESLASSLAHSRATREQVLTSFQEPSSEVSRFWNTATEEMRGDALLLMLGRQDQAAAIALSAQWETIAQDVIKLLQNKVENGETSEVEWCLTALHAAGLTDAEDRLLGRLLVPAGHEPNDYQQYMSALVSLLQERLVPSHGTYQFSCTVLGYGLHTGWQACLVRDLLESETATAQGIPRAVGWVNWLCRSESAGAGERPAWVAALSFMLEEQVNDQSAEGIQLLMRTDAAWAVVILRLAQQARRLPDVLEVADLSLVDLAGRASVSQRSSGSGRFGALLSVLTFNLWRHGGAPKSAAAVDVVRVVLGGSPAVFPTNLAGEYVDGLDRALALEVLGPLRARIGQQILVSTYGNFRRSSEWIELLNFWASFGSLRPSLVEFVAGLSEHNRPFDSQLSHSYWSIFAGDPRLTAYASAGRLLAAALEAVKNPETALLRKTHDSGIFGTELALACYEARVSGLPVQEILRALGHARIYRLTPRILDDTLREFQALLYYTAGAEGKQEIESTSERDLFECYERIVSGEFGDAYGLRFKEQLTARLRAEIQARKQVLSRMGGERGQSVQRLLFGRKKDSPHGG